MADRVELAGQGKLALELERLKTALQKEGLFDESRKRILPDFCERVGVITSTASDAWADFQRHSVEKFSLMKVTVADAFVQGPKAVPSILRALESMQELDLDVIVLTRGGGSLEDLSAFNDEQVVRAIAASRIPTLVAVGHEKDVSIADLVADVRASTPTNAGQLLTYPYERAASALQHYGQLLQRRAIEAVAGPGQELDQLMRHLLHIRHKYQSLPYQLAGLANKLEVSRTGLMQINISRLQQAATALSYQGRQRIGDVSSRLHLAHRHLLAVSPLAVLERGYSLVEINGTIIRNVRQVKQGDTMSVRLHSGSLRGLVTRVEEPDA